MPYLYILYFYFCQSMNYLRIGPFVYPLFGISLCRPFFSYFFGGANRAPSSQIYRARRQNSEPGKKTILGGSLPELCVGWAGVVRKFAKEHLGRRSDIKITCKCQKTVSLINRAIDGLMNGRIKRWRDQQMDGPTDRQTNR